MIQEDDEELRSPKVTILDLDLESDQNDDLPFNQTALSNYNT